jgi:ATP-dependent exoDNAse (exonuclease V) beta subunit
MGELFLFPSEPEKIEPTEESLPSEDGDRPPDYAERERALDVTRSWIVEAPAGSGKTGLLIQRYLKLLALPGVEEPEQVLAITFTLKATGEIRERVLEQLERAAGLDEPVTEFERRTRDLALAVLERDRAHGWNLLEHPKRLNVRTIDSLCAEIAHSLPVLSNIGLLSPVEDASPLYRLASERALMELGGSDTALSDALRLILLHRDGNLTQVRELLSEMLSLRDQWARLVPLGRMLEEQYLDDIVLPEIERALADAICMELTKLAALMPTQVLHELSSLAGELGGNETHNGKASPIAACAGIYQAPGETAEYLEHWRALAHLLVKPSGGWRSSFNKNHINFEIDKPRAARMREIIDHLRDRDDLLAAIERVAALPSANYPKEQWRVAKALFRVLYRALGELQIVFAERGECDFTEPGIIARSALGSEAGVSETALGMKLQHILIDEMQDTSTSQYELIQLLTQGWDGRSQTVFLVGDPKQSIYLFRQARVERFIQTMQQQSLGSLSLGSLRLTANFRSQRNLVQSFNENFALLFPGKIEETHSDAVPYVTADPVRGASPVVTQSTEWHTQVVPPGGTTEDRRRLRRRLARREATEVRRIIEEWRSRPLPPNRTSPWKIAVLVRNRPHLVEIVTELKRDRQNGPIPFRAVNIEPLDERPEVLDLFALTRALIHPADRIAWLAVLRAPWCGLELSELHILAGADESDFFERTIEELITERGQELSEESCERLARIWPVLRAALSQHSRMPLSEWVERTWRSLGGDAPLTAEESTNARKYFDLLDELEGRGTVDLTQLRARLKFLYAEPSAEAGAVDLMTIHGAKGLEWDVVLVPGLEKRNRVSRGRLLIWNEWVSTDENAAHVLLAPIVGKGRDSEALNLWLSQIQRSREEAEIRRLFYVACTRAREELHLFGSPDQRQDGAIRQNPGSLLQAAWPAAERSFVDVQIEAKPLIAPLIEMPASVDNLVLPSLAAEADEPKAAILHRLPLSFLPSSRLQPVGIASPAQPAASRKQFERPEGSFEARTFGNTIHAFLESLAVHFSEGAQPDILQTEVAKWSPRIAAVLRSHGIFPHGIERLTADVQRALRNTLSDSSGLWILGSHAQAFSEHSLVSWDETRSSTRLDRVFRGGAEPRLDGDEYLWIIDYKTTQYSVDRQEDFFAREREKYSAQMEVYAKAMQASTDASRIRLGLYYPMLPGLIWWALNE